MLPNLFINGLSTRAMGLLVTDVQGPWDAIAITDPTVAIPGRRGAMRTGAAPVAAPRAVTVTGTIIESDPSTLPGGVRTHADLLTKLANLKALFAIGAIECVLVDQLTVGFLAERSSIKVVMDGPAFAATSAVVTIALQCLDPAIYELEPQCLGFGATRVAVPLGTAPSDCLIRITGATNPVITVRDLTGKIVHTIGLTRSLAVGTDFEEIDTAQMLVTRYQSGVATDDSSALTSGDFEEFVLSPADGDALAGAFPTIEVSGLSAGGWAEVLYNRTYQ